MLTQQSGGNIGPFSAHANSRRNKSNGHFGGNTQFFGGFTQTPWRITPAILHRGNEFPTRAPPISWRHLKLIYHDFFYSKLDPVSGRGFMQALAKKLVRAAAPFFNTAYKHLFSNLQLI
jgi:hypothetical protein